MADYLTVNISSPNTPGLRDLQKREFLMALIEALHKERKAACTGDNLPPLLVKLAPDLNAEQQEELAQTAIDAGIDGLILGNTTLDRPEFLPESFRGEGGGLSGQPLTEKSTGVISNFYKLTKGKMPIIGVGGVSSAKQALYDHIVTAGEATHHALAAREDAFHQSCGNACWYIGTAYAIELLHGLDLNMVDTPQDASFILNSMPGTETRDVEILEQRLKIALDKDLPMICANPDLVVNIGDEQYECAGTFAAMYEEMGGRVVYHGKPHAPVYERCHALLGHGDKSKILAIGDAFHTDIAGANEFGIDSLLNLTGIHWDEVTVAGQPDILCLAPSFSFAEDAPTATTANEPAAITPVHGVAMHGTLKYPADFTHLDYTNPDAPKGGTLKQHVIGSFDSLNPFIVKGSPAAGVSFIRSSLLHSSLMQNTLDEAFSLYGIVAESVEIPEDRSSVNKRGIWSCRLSLPR